MKLRKILQVDKFNLEEALSEYGAKDYNNVKQHEHIFTTFDIFFDRCLSIAIDRNIINDSQRDELSELLISQIKTKI